MTHPLRQRRQLGRRLRRLRAEAIFHMGALRVLAGPAIWLAVAFVSGTTVLHFFGHAEGGPDPTWSQSAIVAYRLLFVDWGLELPEHPIGQVVMYVLPVVGIVLLAEGLLKLGFEVFRKEGQQERWMDALGRSSRQHVILCGLGTVGIRVLEELVAMGEEIIAVERDENSPMIPHARELGAEVFVGDVRAENLMRRLGLVRARAIIVATDDDLVNLEVAMDVREIRKDVPIVMRLFDQRLAQKVGATLGVNASFSTSLLAAPLFAAAALDPSVVGAHRVGKDVLVVMEIAVLRDGHFSRVPIERLLLQHRLSVVAWRGAGLSHWEAQPPSTTVLQPGDGLQIMVHGNRVEEVHQLNRLTPAR
jgi:Trk K+ transport system NAD-binding subunit